MIFQGYDIPSEQRNGGIAVEHAIVKTISLKKQYKTGTQTVAALDGVDFEVKEREFVSIIGKSGCVYFC